MINYERVAEKIFSIIKGHGHILSMYKEDGMDTTDAAEARRFFVAKPNYMITLDEETNTIKINKNSNLELEDLEGIMKQMKNLARENMLNTQVKVFGKEITPKDFAYQAKKFKDANMESITNEASLSRMSGSKKTSYQTLESVKMIVRHRKAVDEDVRGSRSRQIKAIFLEQAGERFRFPHNCLPCARAMARHMYEGGNMQDTIGEYIIESSANLIKLNEFVRYARTNKLMNEANEDIVKTVKENIVNIRSEFKGLTGAKSYARVSEAIAAREASVLEEDDTTDLQNMFTVRKFDEKISGTLPLIRRLMNEKQIWRDALVEASQQTIYMKAKEELAEEDIMEFDNPVQQVGYKIGKLAKRMVESGDLSNFVAKVAGKLIEGDKISDFEKTIVRNVMENAKIEEVIEDDYCAKCGEDMWGDCKCEKPTPENTVESISDAYELKMKMIEHEDIFAEASGKKEPEVGCNSCNETGKNEDDESCANCDGKGRHPASGGLFEDERSEQFQKHSFDDCEACDGSGNVGDLECGECDGSGMIITRVEESEGEKCIRCRKGTMQLGDTMMGPAKECDRCNYTVQVNESESEDKSENDLGYDPKTQWMDPAGGVHDNDEDDPAAMYEEELNELRQAAGIEIVEADAEKAGSGNVDPEDFMDDCPDCGGSGETGVEGTHTGLQKCMKCKGEGYV